MLSRPRTLLTLAAGALALAVPEAASAAFPHVVAPGESLTSVAAADGLTIDQLATANRISPGSQLIVGTTLLIPPQQAGYNGSLSGRTAPAPVTTATAGDDDAAEDGSATPVSYSSSSYVVQPGDTLTAIAARAGVTVASLAAANGLDPNGVLLSGTPLSLTGQAPATTVGSPESNAAVYQPVGPAAVGDTNAGPYPTAERVSSTQIGQIAAANDVPASLAQAIGWQESGFNNDLTSTAGARGVMQIMPGTWNWIGQTMAGETALMPASATDNVRGGVLLLHSLLNATGGDPAMAAAGYYQGLPSVEKYGMFADTQQYVNDVLALRQRFSGGG